MTSVGETLKRERLRRGWNLEQVSRETKISSRLLEYIESEQFDKLPGGVFTRSFVRQYASTLGLDGDEIASELQRQIHIEPEPALLGPETTQPEAESPPISVWTSLNDRFPPSSSSVPAFILVVVVIILCSVIYGLWQREARDTAVAARDAVQTAPEPPPVESTPAPAAANPKLPEASPVPSTTAESGSGGVHVSLTAGEPTWLSLSADGKRVFAGILAPNQTKTVQGNEKVRVLLGNAGGVAISLNGKPIGAVGSRGQVRIVHLTAAGFQIVPREGSL